MIELIYTNHHGAKMAQIKTLGKSKHEITEICDKNDQKGHKNPDFSFSTRHNARTTLILNNEVSYCA